MFVRSPAIDVSTQIPYAPVWMRSLFAALCTDQADVEARSLLALSLFIGTRFTAAEHGSRTRAQVLALAVERLLA